MSSLDKSASNLARNLRLLREARSQTQQQLARLSGVPRPTVANLESGSANPTLSVLVRVAAALGVSIEELIGPPRSSVRFFPAASVPVEVKHGVTVRQVVPDAIPGVAAERMALPPGSVMRGTPHTPGTREYLTCERGEVRLAAGGETWTLTPGDVMVFRGDQPHSYANRTDDAAVAFSIVLLTPVPE